MESGELKPDEQTYAKEQLGVRTAETKILGLHWRKSDDSLIVICPKRPYMIIYLASIYDPLGFASLTW